MRDAVLNIFLKILILTLGTLSLSGLSSQPKSGCVVTEPEISLNTEIYLVKAGANCVVYVTPLNKNASFRSYLFSENGLLQVFNSFNGTERKDSTGVRAFFLFPRKYKAGFKMLSDGNLQVRTSSGGAILIDGSLSRITSISDSEFQEKAEVEVNNNGGFEIEKSNFLFLDSGFARGDSPYSDSTRNSIFQDPKGSRCEVRNNLIFDYVRHEAKLKGDAELALVLPALCPSLDITSLKNI